MYFQDTEYYQTIMSLYEKISSLNEPYNLNEEHSEQWNAILDEMSETAKKLIKDMSPNFMNKIKYYDLKEISEELESYLDQKDYLEEFPYKRTMVSILRNYKKEKGNFDKYFCSSLYQNMRRFRRDELIRKINQNTMPKMSFAARKKIFRCCAILYKYNEEHPEKKKLKLDSNDAKQLFLEKKVCKNKESLDKLLLYNSSTFVVNNKGNNNSESNSTADNMDSIEEEQKQFSKTEYVEKVDISEAIEDTCTFIDECYKSYIQLKKQNKTAQLKKEKFLSEVLTCHYYFRFKEILDAAKMGTDYIYQSMISKKFTSKKILSIFDNYETKIAELFKANKTYEANALIKFQPVTVETISKENEYTKNPNYGYRVIKAFRDYALKIASDENYRNHAIKKTENKNFEEYILEITSKKDKIERIKNYI